ncbi:MAG TPA: hypothetical protein EYQ60_01300 [Myxococcales bacterium]|nr:hypothetical protein [Myxococcales bacterium]
MSPVSRAANPTALPPLPFDHLRLKFSATVPFRMATAKNVRSTEKILRIVFHAVIHDGSGEGWLEDRRPASNADPYKVAGRIVKTVKAASANIKA